MTDHTTSDIQTELVNADHCARLLRRARHLDHRSLAPRALRRARHLRRRRHRPGRERARRRARKGDRSGADECYVEDLRQEFVESFIYPTLRAGAIYNRKYLLGTSMARPLIAKRQVEVARAVGADALAHGCTGKGNDQVRFELTYMAFAPDLPVIAPWREWDIRSREDALAYAAARNIPVAATHDEDLLARPQPLAHLARGRRARGSERGAAEGPVPAHDGPAGRARRRRKIVTIGFERARRSR